MTDKVEQFNKGVIMNKTEQAKFLDECAMRAMQALFTNLLSDQDVPTDSIYMIPDMSYDLAEAMLKEKLKREKGDE